MSASSPSGWLQQHLPVVLFGWFWFGMFLCGLLAPQERVAELGSAVVTEGWHLSAMCVLLGLPVLVGVVLRSRSRDSKP